MAVWVNYHTVVEFVSFEWDNIATTDHDSPYTLVLFLCVIFLYLILVNQLPLQNTSQGKQG